MRGIARWSSPLQRQGPRVCLRGCHEGGGLVTFPSRHGSIHCLCTQVKLALKADSKAAWCVIYGPEGIFFFLKSILGTCEFVYSVVTKPSLERHNTHVYSTQIGNPQQTKVQLGTDTPKVQLGEPIFIGVT